MADELSVTVAVRHTKEPKLNLNPSAAIFDQTGEGVFSAVQEIGTSEEDVTITGITTLGLCVLRNLDDTNYIDIGKKDGGGNMQETIKLGPTGGAGTCAIAVFPLAAGITLRAKANTAACNLQIFVYEA